MGHMLYVLFLITSTYNLDWSRNCLNIISNFNNFINEFNFRKNLIYSKMKSSGYLRGFRDDPDSEATNFKFARKLSKQGSEKVIDCKSPDY